MEVQNKVVLAIGSNLGNRLEYIQGAIESIHNEVGTVVKVSRLYETPAWGFESGAFYNCALLLHTACSAQEILERILGVENKLGRIRSADANYQARTIDIDMISFNEDIIESENLQIPHPLMQERMFVLAPMRDLKLEIRIHLLLPFS